MKSTENCWEPADRLGTELKLAETVVIGAGAGLSASAGFDYSGRRFRKYFQDFEEKYGFHDMYAGGFYPYETPEEYWAYWSRYIYINRYMDPPRPVYRNLLELVRDKDYFVITTNVDHCFQKAGFDRERLFYTQGDYGLFQCSRPCRQETFDNEALVLKMVERQKDGRVPADLIPLCPHCGRPMTDSRRISTGRIDRWDVSLPQNFAFCLPASSTISVPISVAVSVTAASVSGCVFFLRRIIYAI